jgi:hypothetical protein
MRRNQNPDVGHEVRRKTGTAGMMAGQRGWLLGSQPALRAM